MIGILSGFLRTHQGCCCTAVVPVGNVKCRHLGEFFGYDLNIFLPVDNPECMAETVVRSHKVINRLLCRVTGNDRIQHCIVGISEEYGLDVGIVHTDMLHAVFFLVAASKLMLLDNAVHVIGHVCAHHQTILRLTVHGLGIYVIVLLIVLHQPAFVLEHPEVLGRFPVHTFIVLVRTYRKSISGL